MVQAFGAYFVAPVVKKCNFYSMLVKVVFMIVCMREYCYLRRKL